MNSTYKTSNKRAAGGRAIVAGILVAGGLFSQTLLAQQSYTFTNCTATGNTGPTQSMVNAAYASTNLNGSVTIGAQQGIQQFTIPISGAYKIEAYGAQGYGAGGVGGRGAYMSGEFNFTAGQVLKILVGQQGELPANSSYNAQYGGGGGSFVTDGSNVPFVVAGGGGANWSSAFSTISDAPVTTSGNNSGGVGSTTSAGGASGAGGGTANSADGGGGITGNGSGTSAGQAYVNGGLGGFTTYGIGGFGGGGGTSSFNNRRAAGGGGYSGGGAAEGVTTGFPEAGGGGSYNAGVNQVNTAGINLSHGKVIISELCNMAASAVSNPICIGSAVTLTTNATGTISWSSGGSTSSISVSPSVTTTYTVTGGGTGTNVCTATRVVTVVVQPLPVISAVVNPTLICVGGTATVSAAGASSYTWSSSSTGSNTTLNPSVNTTYTVSGSSIYGCINSNTFMVKVNTNTMGITASTPSVCAGDPVTLNATGVVSCTWTSGSYFLNLTVNPTNNSVYTASGRDANYCLLSSSVSVSVKPKPVVFASADRNLICKGESATITAVGATSYNWGSLGTGSVIVVTLPVDITYTYMVTGTDSNGCTDTALVSVNVNRCLGINESSKLTNVKVMPNPAHDNLVISSESDIISEITLSDVTGRVLLEKSLNSNEDRINMSEFANGVYWIKVRSGSASNVIKVVKE